MKSFLYDTILDAGDICDHNREREDILAAINNKRNVVIYGPRNYGKTSLVKSVIVPSFQKKHGKAFVLFADLMQVKDLSAIDQRIQSAFEMAFKTAFPGKHLVNAVTKFTKSLRPEISFDPVTGTPTVAFNLDRKRDALPFRHVFTTIRDSISRVMPTLIVLDEFQDIASVDQAQGLLRDSLQNLRKTPVILMGSQQHLLTELLGKPSAPLSGFGEDVIFDPIPYEDYYHYIMDRMRGSGLSMSIETCIFLQNELQRIPEAINIVCAEIQTTRSKIRITDEHIREAINRTVEKRRKRFEQQVAFLTINEEHVLAAVAKKAPVAHPTGKEFMAFVSMTPRSIQIVLSKLMALSIIERHPDGYRLVDPLMAHFLRFFR